MNKPKQLTKIKQLGKKTQAERQARIDELDCILENNEGQEKLSKTMQKLQLEKAILEDIQKKY